MVYTKVEGVTSFTAPPPVSYRYTIELKKNKLSIWMENPATKQQWYKGDMDKSDYVVSANTIPNAAPVDYVKVFNDCLMCNRSDTNSVQRFLTVLSGGAVRLQLVLRIQFLQSTWVAKFQFVLDPVTVERIDMLESKLRDQQDELDQLRRDVSVGRNAAFIKLIAASKDGSSSMIWNRANCAEFVIDRDDGVIKVRVQGVYSIRGVINCVPLGYSQKVRLWKNGECIQSNFCAYIGRDRYTCAPLDCLALLNDGGELKVVCNCELVSESHLSIVSVAI